MIKIKHRINTIEELKQVPQEYGVELDIRYEADRLILHHDPFVTGEDFDQYLEHYKHRFIILNLKTEGIEEAVLKLMQKHNIDDYFMLDLSLPYLVKYANKGVKKMAVRYSEYEPIELAMSFKNKLDWLWLDCFTHLPLNMEQYQKLKQNFKLALVSPELQGHGLEQIENYKKQLKDMEIDAVCTKRPDLW